MSKKTSLAAALVLLATAVPAMAAPSSVTANVNVSATLTPVCTIASNNISLNYTSFQQTDSTGTGTLTIKCTQGQTYGLAISSPTGNSVLGLAYSVDIVSGGSSVSTGTGTGADDTTKAVKATITSGQSGTASGASASYTATSATTHTVTLTY